MNIEMKLKSALGVHKNYDVYDGTHKTVAYIGGGWI